jgi:adenylosuccinate synthase
LGAIVIVDAFWGDAGKGKFCAYFATKYNAKYAVRAGTGTNSGHSIYVNGNRIACRMLPLGWMNQETVVFIGSGVAINPTVFLEEVRNNHLEGRAFVDLRCPVIENWHIDYEKVHDQMIAIDSTDSGTGKARADFVMRQGRQAKDVPELQNYLIDGISEINNAAIKDCVVIEGSQGTHLSLYASNRYPYVTSDNCTTAAFLDDVSLNWQLIDKVVLLVKCLPTCAGPGHLPFEMSKDEIIKHGLEEYGVNTGRFKRRSSSIDFNYLDYSIRINGPTEIALTYCDQYDVNMTGCKSRNTITNKLYQLIDEIEGQFNIPITYLETGKDHNDILDLSM